jgi:hypothetical protein
VLYLNLYEQTITPNLRKVSMTFFQNDQRPTLLIHDQHQEIALHLGRPNLGPNTTVPRNHRYPTYYTLTLYPLLLMFKPAEVHQLYPCQLRDLSA